MTFSYKIFHQSTVSLVNLDTLGSQTNWNLPGLQTLEVKAPPQDVAPEVAQQIVATESDQK